MTNPTIITTMSMTMNTITTTMKRPTNMNTGTKNIITMTMSTIITTVLVPAGMTMMPMRSSSAGAETPRKYTEEEISGALHALGEEANYGVVLRAKGIVPCQDGTWIHFDYVPGEQNIRRGPAGFTGRLCVIGSELKEHALEHLFCLH